jgi:multidrug efflux pump subunit AcrA (membrane-fusion protein)
MDTEAVDLAQQEDNEPDLSVPTSPDLSPLPEPERPRHSRPQRIGGFVIAAACLAAAIWYVPRVISNDNHQLTGTVTSSGVVSLNFTKAGYLASVPVRAGQAVHKGQTLATEYAPATSSLLTADKAAISSDQARLAQLKAVPVADQTAEVAAANAQLAKDEATLASDKVNAEATQIVAPSAGTVIAVNGAPGETVSATGLKTGASSSQTTQTSQAPLFSLLPEGPQSSKSGGGSGSALPVVELRTSATWHVVALIPESQVSSVKAGQPVTISVPSSHLKDIKGQVQEILPTPTSTSSGLAYQAVVSVTGKATAQPMDGMAADVRIGS